MSITIEKKEVEFPAISQVSFHKLFEVLDKMADSSDNSISIYASTLLKELETYPELKQGFSDLDLIEKYKAPIEKICQLVLPEALQDNEIKGIIPSFSFSPFITSRRLKKILAAAGDNFNFSVSSIDPDTMYKIGCTYVLEHIYGYSAPMSHPFIIEIPNEDKQRPRFYRIAFNADLMEVKATEKAPKITKEDYLELINNFDNIQLWKTKFPPNSYIMRGIGIMNMMDITHDHSINLVTSNLLATSTDNFSKIRYHIQTIMNMDDLQIGIVGLENQKIILPPEKDSKSYFLAKGLNSVNSKKVLCSKAINQLLNNKEPFILPDVDKYYNLSGSQLGKNLVDNDIKSYVAVPLLDKEELLGFIEFASPKKYALNTFVNARMEDLIPIMAMAAARFKEEAANKIEALIQQECTTIHPSVKWRFEEDAKNFMREQELGGKPRFHDIIFKDVYPLYGQMDIKDSSVKRKEAVISDLVAELSSVLNILNQALKVNSIPIFEELIFRINSRIKEVKKGLTADSEHEITSFLKKEIYPIFNHIKGLDPTLSSLIENYNDSLDPNLGILYNERKKFDESVSNANHLMASFIDKKQKKAQKIFPHYFERYKTDGIDYNLYIGQSIVKKGKFNSLFLKNLRLWQLIVMCQLENEFKRLQGELTSSLEVASLILVYNTPLAVHFRMDEKRFDVEGAYNARYEIIKKRVDKAYIRGTKERVTVPGKIAIVYTNEQDKMEYLTYIDFMESKGYLKKGCTEDVFLKDLQGITGLKALRVTLSYSDDIDTSEGFTYAELISSIK